MDGINYEHGEKWQRKDQPCTTYECQNGYYEAVYRGITEFWQKKEKKKKGKYLHQDFMATRGSPQSYGNRKARRYMMKKYNRHHIIV